MSVDVDIKALLEAGAHFGHKTSRWHPKMAQYIHSKRGNTLTKNLHLEHPEDMILSGHLEVLDWFSAISNISVKMDGAPAIVWGTNPENGQFFVGTKSVFNKKKMGIKDISMIFSHGLDDFILDIDQLSSGFKNGVLES